MDWLSEELPKNSNKIYMRKCTVSELIHAFHDCEHVVILYASVINAIGNTLREKSIKADFYANAFRDFKQEHPNVIDISDDDEFVCTIYPKSFEISGWKMTDDYEDLLKTVRWAYDIAIAHGPNIEVSTEIPEGYVIDKERSTFEKIVFKPKSC